MEWKSQRIKTSRVSHEPTSLKPKENEQEVGRCFQKGEAGVTRVE